MEFNQTADSLISYKIGVNKILQLIMCFTPIPHVVSEAQQKKTCETQIQKKTKLLRVHFLLKPHLLTRYIGNNL